MTSQQPTRRTALKVGAWSIPAVATALAVPLASASTASCPIGFRPQSLTALAFSIGSVGNTAQIVLPGTAFGLDSTSADWTAFQPTFELSVLSATLTMTPTPNQPTEYSASAVTATTMGVYSSATALPGYFLFPDVHMPSGTYIINSNPRRPVSLSVTVSLATTTTDGTQTLNCPVTLRWNLDGYSVGVITPSFLGGSGTLTFTGTSTPDI